MACSSPPKPPTDASLAAGGDPTATATTLPLTGS